MDALDLQYRFGPKDQRLFAAWYAATDPGHKAARDSAVTWLVLVSAVVAAAIGRSQEPSGRLIAVFLVATIGIGVSIWYWRTYTRRAADAAVRAAEAHPSPGSNDATTVHADAAGISFGSSVGEARFSWAAFTHLSDTGAALVLWRGYFPYAVITREACQAVGFDNVATYLRAHIPPPNKSLERTREG